MLTKAPQNNKRFQKKIDIVPKLYKKKQYL